MTTREAITAFLFLRNEPQPVDLCLVLGSRYAETMDPAIELWRRGWTPRILITGHGPEDEQEKEADVFCEYAVCNGVSTDSILVEREARHTRDNFELSVQLIEDRSLIHRVAIVGKPYHMRRAKMTAERFWPAKIEYVMLPSDLPQHLKAEDWWQIEWGRFRVLDELRRIGL